MFNHCILYKYNIYKILSTVFLILFGILYAYANTNTSPTNLPEIALLGDSMTWIGGDSCQNSTGWSYVLKESGIVGKIDVYAKSGATWTNTKSTRRNPQHKTEVLHDDNVIYNQVIRLIENSDVNHNYPDIIVLFAGANDAWFKSKRPGMFEKEDSHRVFTTYTEPSSVTTLEGSVRLVCDILQKKFPYTTLLFVTPLQMAKIDAETIFKVSDIIEKTASPKGCHVIRPDKDTEINHEQEAKSPKYTYDGVHTNPEGARIVGEYIIKYLTSKINIPQSLNKSTDN